MRYPIAQSRVMCDAIREFCQPIVCLFFHCLIIVFQTGDISIKLIYSPGDNGYRASPVQNITTPSSGRDDTSQTSSVIHIIPMIIHPFFIQCDSIKIIKSRLNGQMRVTRPAILFPMGAIGRIAYQVGKIRVIGSTPQSVYQRIGTFKAPDRRHICMYKVRGEVLFCQFQRLVRRDLYILESFIIKTRSECVLFTVQDKHIRLEQFIFRMLPVLQRFIYILIKLRVVIIKNAFVARIQLLSMV